jgi:hypothetical protein
MIVLYHVISAPPPLLSIMAVMAMVAAYIYHSDGAGPDEHLPEI